MMVETPGQLRELASASVRDAHRPGWTLLAPPGILVAVAVWRTVGSIACLALATAATSVIRTRRIGPIVLMLWRSVVAGRGIRRGSLGLPLNMPYARLLWPGGCLVWICVDMSDDWGGAFGAGWVPIAFFGAGRRIIGVRFCDNGMTSW